MNLTAICASSRYMNPPAPPTVRIAPMVGRCSHTVATQPGGARSHVQLQLPPEVLKEYVRARDEESRRSRSRENGLWTVACLCGFGGG